VPDKSEADDLFAAGRKLYIEKEFTEALEVLKSAQKLYNQIGGKQEAGIASSYVGRALEALGKHREALVSYSQAVQLLRDSEEFNELKLALVRLGVLLEELNYLKEAAKAFDQAADTHERLGEIKEQQELLLRAGVILERLGQLEASHSRYVKAVEIARTLSDSSLYIDALSSHARILLQLEDFQEAEIVFQKLIQLCSRTGKQIIHAHALLGLASTYISRRQLDRAEDLILQSEERFIASEDDTGAPYIAFHRARIKLHQGQLEDALVYAEQALKTFQDIDNPEGRVQCHLILGQIHEKLEQWKKALSHYDLAIEVLEVLGNQTHSLETRVTKGKLLLQIGRERLAEREFSYVIKHYKENQSLDREARVYLEVAQKMNGLGKYEAAREQSRRAIQKLQETEDEEREMLAYLILLKSSQSSDSLEEDLPFLKEGLEKAKTQGKTSVVSSLSASLALLSLDLEAPQDREITVLEEALQNMFLPKEQRMEIALSLGTVLAKQERFAEVVQYLSQAIKGYSIQPSYEKAKTYYLLSEAYQHLNQPEQRRDSLEKALASLPQKIDYLLQARILHQLASLVAEEDTEKACKNYLLAAKLFEAQDIPDDLFDALLGGATLLVKLRRTKLALQIVEQALSLADELSITTREPEHQSREFIHLRKAAEVALYTASVHIEKHASQAMIEKMFNWSSRRKTAILIPFLPEKLGCRSCKDLPILSQEEARLIKQARSLHQKMAQQTLRESRQQRSEHRQQLNDILAQIDAIRGMITESCIDPGKTLPPREYKILPKVLAIMPQDRKWVLVNYDILRSQNKIAVTWIDHRGHYGSSLLPLTKSLKSVVSRLRSIRDTTDLPPQTQLQKIGTQLYRFLIPTNLAKELRSEAYNFIQLVTDDFLHHLPFEMIFDGMQFWGLKYAVSWTPDIAFLENTMRSHAASTAPSTVVLGVKTSNEKQRSGKHIAEEITKTFLAAVPISHEHVGEPVVLFGRDFTRELLIESCNQPCSLVFLSTLTSIHHRKGEIALRHPDSLRAVELGTTTTINGTPTLVLDYCIQQEPREDGLSLAGFLRCLKAAGAVATIFTRWQPNPNTRAFFAATIATQLYEGNTLAVALQQARRMMSIKDTTSNSWLAYTLCGSPYPALF
jgi:tetratricopeptide (TPR) repeat protein